MGKLGGGVLGLNHLKKNYGDGITEEDFATPVKNVAKSTENKETEKIQRISVSKPKKQEIGKKEIKKVKRARSEKLNDGNIGEARITARISEDFDREISLYCIDNDIKRVDLAKEALSRVIGGEDSPSISLKGDNCKVIITRNDKCKVLSFRVDENMKKAVRKYVFEAQLSDPEVSENYVLAQAIADYIGYKRKMRFN